MYNHLEKNGFFKLPVFSLNQKEKGNQDCNLG